MSNGNVRTGATSLAEGAQQISSPEDVRVYRVEAAIGVLDVAMSSTYPDILLPDTIAATAETSSDPVAASNAARVSEISFIQGAVQDPRWN
ncbi:MAG TPA: hypothetical protein VGO07_06055 [Candidatus Saccharimonadales bacterium]|jgi:hypothetical protein|nr:hypothetical protein [Candidatus Saccharimonadales bacterium]